MDQPAPSPAPPPHAPAASRPTDPPAGSARLEYCVALGLALLLYLISVAPGALWQDSGLAQVRVLQRDLQGPLGLALSHPLYYAFALLFQGLPFEESAYKTNLVSAVLGAVTVANVFALLRRLTRRADAAAVGAISLALAHTYWQHCALAEVYTVSTALLSGQLLCMERFLATRRAPWLVLTYLVNGAELSNHPLALLSIAIIGLLTLWLIARRELSPLILIPAAFAWALGAGLILALIAREIGGGTPPATAIRSALVGHFAPAVFALLPTPALLVRSALYLGLNFPTPAALLILVGVARLRRLQPARFGALLAGLTGLHLLWAIRYDVPDQYTFFIVSAMLMSILIGLGAADVLARRPAARWALLAAAALPALVYALLPSIAAAARLPLGLTRTVPFRDEYTYFLQPWKTGERGPLRFAEELYSTLPPFSVVIADETTVRPLHYYRLTRDPRPLLVEPSIRKAFGWDDIDEQFLQPQVRAGRVFVVTPQPGYCPAWLLADGKYDFVAHGSVFRVVPRAPATASAPAGAPSGASP